MAAIALTITAMALLISAPFINVLALGGGVRWLAAYGAVAAIGISAAAVAIAFTVMLFRTLGPRRSRLVAQILAVVIGASFIIGLQIAAVLSYGTLSRFAVLTSDATAAFAPDAGSLVWLPVRAVLGDGWALAGVLGFSLTLLGVTMTDVPEFHRNVYAIARTIAPGDTLTYGDIAKRLGGVELSRDVGQALGRNPWADERTTPVR